MTKNNIYDTANQLERDLRNLDAYKNLVASLNAIKDDESTNELFESFKNFTIELQNKQMQGVQPSEDEMKKYQDFLVKVSDNENINKFMDCERQLSQIMEDINRIITVPLQEVYQN